MTDDPFTQIKERERLKKLNCILDRGIKKFLKSGILHHHQKSSILHDKENSIRQSNQKGTLLPLFHELDPLTQLSYIHPYIFLSLEETPSPLPSL